MTGSVWSTWAGYVVPSNSCDDDSLNLVDDVVVGHDIPAAVDEHAAPHPVDQRQAILRRRKRPATVRGGQLLARDAHHAVLNLFDGLDHGGPPRTRILPEPRCTACTSCRRETETRHVLSEASLFPTHHGRWHGGRPLSDRLRLYSSQPDPTRPGSRFIHPRIATLGMVLDRLPCFPA